MLDSVHQAASEMETRQEEDLLGARAVPVQALYGVHTVRAVENFPLQSGKTHPALTAAFGQVKLACARTNRALGAWANDPAKAEAIETACNEMTKGLLNESIVLDPLQGGAGTSMNMNVNEVIANRALQLVHEKPGSYGRISPLDDVNKHQSTNDTYPTSLKVATIACLKKLNERLEDLEKAFERKTQEFAHVLKIGRTQLQDAVPITLGREMGAYGHAIRRDRARIVRAVESLCVVNLGGTAIGTGIAATKDYILQVAGELAKITGYPIVRAEDMVDNTQNADVFVEASSVLKTCAATFVKIATDLRILCSGPDAGIAEIDLPARQAGSSIMPGKVNPVIPEAVTQAAFRVIGYDLQVTLAAGAGNLELNPFEPLMADCLLNGADLLGRAADILRERCLDGLTAREEKCRARVESSTALATALVAPFGYTLASRLVKKAKKEGKTIRQVVLEEKVATEEEFDRLISPNLF